MKSFLIILAVLVVLLAGSGVAFFAYVGAKAPETFVVTGGQMTQGQMEVVRGLGLLEEGEPIKHFYSDGFLDVRDGMYFLTDRKLVLYDDDWVEPKVLVPFDRIDEVALERDESFFIDSYITILLDDGDAWGFPVSSERGGDQLFYDYLATRATEASEEAPAEALESSDD